MKKIILTGGGTAGHVTPNIALLPLLKENHYEISYIGSYTGIEKELIEEQGIPYDGISSGKLRRYFDVKNFTDPFRVIRGYFQSVRIMKRRRPDVVFSKGGFVAVPVVLAARRLHIPVICHESDITPGLANKLAIPSATKVCCNFPETQSYLPEGKSVLTGSPIRQELLSGDPQEGLRICGFTDEKPVLMIIGGSSGAVAINDAVRRSLGELLKTFQVVHLCGAGNLDHSLDGQTGYIQFEYVKDDLRHLFAAADLLISRAGANAICEILALQKPNILIPLPKGASRGDQILNAESFERSGYSYVLQQEQLTEETLLQAVTCVYENQGAYRDAMAKSPMPNAAQIIFDLIEEVSS